MLKVQGSISKHGYTILNLRIRRKKLGKWKPGDRFSVCVRRNRIVLKLVEEAKLNE